MKIVSFNEFVEKKCKNCANKDKNYCEVKRLTDNSVDCVYYKDTKEKED